MSVACSLNFGVSRLFASHWTSWKSQIAYKIECNPWKEETHIRKRKKSSVWSASVREWGGGPRVAGMIVCYQLMMPQVWGRRASLGHRLSNDHPRLVSYTPIGTRGELRRSTTARFAQSFVAKLMTQSPCTNMQQEILSRTQNIGWFTVRLWSHKRACRV